MFQNFGGIFRCTCQPGYGGRQCEREIEECSSSPCLNGGTCRDLTASYTCTCLPGYTGEAEQTKLFNRAMNTELTIKKSYANSFILNMHLEVNLCIPSLIQCFPSNALSI